MDSQTLVQRAFKKYQREGLRSFFRSLYRYSFDRIIGQWLFRYSTRIRYKKQRYIYNAPAHPYKLINVNVDDINFFNKSLSTKWGLGRIVGGDWNSKGNCVPIQSTTHYRGFKQHFEKGYDWRDTVYFQNRKASLTAERLKYIDELFDDIKKNGYCPNYKNHHDAIGDGRQGRHKHIHSLEPLVLIDREGEIYLSEGFHRIVISKIVGIEKIPVNILARHKKWQNKREKLATSSTTYEASPIIEDSLHPDLNDLY